MENADSFESEGVDRSHENSFVATTTETELRFLEPEPAVMNQLEQQQISRKHGGPLTQASETVQIVGYRQQTKGQRATKCWDASGCSSTKRTSTKPLLK